LIDSVEFVIFINNLHNGAWLTRVNSGALSMEYL